MLRRVKVRTIMDRKFQTVPPSAAADEVRRLLQNAPHGELFVVDAAGALTGTITFHDLRETAFDTGRDDEISAADLARCDPPVLLVDDALDRALDILEAHDEPHIPVVENRDDMVLVGVVHERDVVLALNRALADADHTGPRRRRKRRDQ